MTTPIRQVKDAPLGAITATPAKVKNALAIRVMKIRGVSAKRKGR